MQRRTFLTSSLIAAAAAAAPFLPARAAGSLPYDDKGDPFAFVVDLSNAVLERIRGSDSRAISMRFASLSTASSCRRPTSR